MGLFGSHSGSWLGLPDFGVTEAIQKVVAPSSSYTSQGGSNLLGGQKAASPTYDYSQAKSTPISSPTRSGSVLGTGTSSVGSYSAPTSGQQQQGPSQPVDPWAGLRNEISSGWDSYLGSLDNIFNGLNDQRSSQEGIAQSQLNQGNNTLDLQYNQGEQALGQQRVSAEQNQSRTLRDLAQNLRNSFMAGNVYLGARGAGDSSAANQYAGALTKLGSRQRTDVMNNTANIMNDIGARMTNLKNVVDTEKRNLQEGYNQQINKIATWFAEAQNQVRQQKASGQLSKSQDLASLSKDILNQAMSQLNMVQQQAAQRQSMLDQWAISNATNLQQLGQNMRGISSPSYQLPQAQSIVGAPQMTANGGVYVPAGYGSTDQRKLTPFA